MHGQSHEEQVMSRFAMVVVLILALSLTVSVAVAAPTVQLAAPNQMGVTMGQLCYWVRDVEANRKFWVTLGALPVRSGEKQAALKFQGLLIVLNQGEPAGNSEGSVLNHVGFQVANLQQIMDKVRAAGYKTAPATFGS
jgi:hypothetical protein